MPEVLDGGGGDAGTARGTHGEEEGAVGELDYGGGDGGLRTLAGLGVVTRGGDVAECVGGTGGGKIVHLVVQYNYTTVSKMEPLFEKSGRDFRFRGP